jgi:hypothetical protein
VAVYTVHGAPDVVEEPDVEFALPSAIVLVEVRFEEIEAPPPPPPAATRYVVVELSYTNEPPPPAPAQ